MFIPTDPHEKITQLRDFDPLQTAADITGDQKLKDRETNLLGLGLAHLKHEQLNSELKKAKDVYRDMPFTEVLALLEEDKWEKLLDEDIPFPENDPEFVEYCKNVQDKFMIFWKNGILLTLDTYWGQRNLNTMKIYFELKAHGYPRLFCANGGSYCVATRIDENTAIWEISSGVDQGGFRVYLKQIQELGTICETWYKNPKHDRFIWLLSHGDTKDPNYDYKAINQNRLDKLPDHVVRAMGRTKTSWKESE